ncbi:GmrSD restriction endonuclease domain-containing protein [Herpetosiphon giganteus]|uniref:GmrSD restriction endonuclease domain-containing protein n=1 Tax=Herpetosiphon giganteus TaxID=2029754 RepID=UPI00195BE76D|nr:DUF262 domain-containing protein [Herpetosiphon giganteus]MBM7845433.1 hypothetical protein [Herpetosiphon giganteus]
MISSHDHKIQELVNDIEHGHLLLPEMQRGYVWKSTQVRDLFDSLYRGYPSGQLLVWSTTDLPATSAISLQGSPMQSKTGRQPDLLLDGQQRMTSLSAILKGRPVQVRSKTRPIDIVFNVHSEQFDVATPRHRNDPNWVSLIRLFAHGAMTIMQEQFQSYGFSPEGAQIMDRLNRIDKIRDYTYRVNRLTDVDYDEVTDIFVRINSGGTRLSSADLTLAQLSSRWSGITNEFEDFRQHVEKKFGIEIGNGMIIRTLASMFSGQSRPAYMFRGQRSQATVEEIAPFWQRLKPAMEQALTFLVHNCLIDRLWMLPTQAILVPLTQYFDRFGAHISTRDARLLQRWVYLALIWSRYSSSPESTTDQDVSALGNSEPILAMTQNIFDRSGERPIDERQLRDQRSNSPFMVMSYVLARMNNAQDWFNGVQIGAGQHIEYHHIFPKALLSKTYSLRNDSRIVDQVANLAFLSSSANKKIGSKPPSVYIPGEHIEPARLKAQSVPNNPALWENFEAFVIERRKLLAEAINKLLDSLTDAPALWPRSDVELIEQRIAILEHQLRDIVAQRLTESFGEHAWEQAIPSYMRKTFMSRVEQRINQHPYEHDQYSSLAARIGMGLFSDYRKIMKEGKNWPLFSDVFGDGKKFDQHMDAVLVVRNAMAHHNHVSNVDLHTAEAGLLWFEECLHKVDLVRDEGEDETDEVSSDD